MGRTSNAREQQPRITLRNYLDMSRSLNMDPSGSARQHGNPRRFDMTKSLNAESGFFSKPSRASGKPKQDGTSAAAANSSAAGVGRPTVAKSPLSVEGFPSRASFHTGLNGKTLPASPNIQDSSHEKELIDAFVDQLRNIAASSSSSEPTTTTRRVVRRALEFSTSLSAAQRVTVATPDHSKRIKESMTRASAGNRHVEGDDALSRRLYRSNIRSDLRRQQFLPVVVEEKQTVISSPICHTSSTRMKLKAVDMPPAIQQHAVECAFQLLKTMDCKLNCKLIAWQLKKEFDKIHGPAWHCIVGTSFGSYVTHSVGCFIYFAVGKVSILLFRTAIEVVDRK